MEASYVYAYFDPSTKLPFYIGKGKGRRMNHHLQEAKKEASLDTNLHKIRRIRKILASGLEPEIKVIDSGLTDDDAYELEEFMIGWLGRRDEGTGYLTNLSDGGEGGRGIRLYGERNPSFGKRGEASPLWGRTHTAEALKKMHLSQVGKELTEDHKAAMRKPKSEEGRAAIALARQVSTYRPTEETRAKISAAGKGRPSSLKGRTLTAEHRAKIGAAGKGRESHRKGKTVHLSDEAKASLRLSLKERNERVVACPHCKKAGKFVGMIRWHMDNCKEKTTC